MHKIHEIKEKVASADEFYLENAVGITKEELNWLIEQAETLKKIADTWVAIETNRTSEDADNFYTIVQDILSPTQ